jgi:hypothetical protein
MTNNTTGPSEMDIEFDKMLGNNKQKTRAKIYRPVKVRLGYSILIRILKDIKAMVD